MRITKKISRLDHKTLSDIKHSSIALEKGIVFFFFFYCKVSKLKPNLLVAMDTLMPFFPSSSSPLLFFLPVVTSAYRFLNL